MTAFLDRPYRTFGGGDVLFPGLKPGAMMWTVTPLENFGLRIAQKGAWLMPHLSRVSNPWKGFSMINSNKVLQGSLIISYCCLATFCRNPSPVPLPFSVEKGRGNSIPIIFPGFHDIDIEYNAVPMTAFLDRLYWTFGGGDALSPGLKPKATIIYYTILTAEIVLWAWLVALSDLIGY